MSAAVRERLKKGASQVKIGAGVLSIGLRDYGRDLVAIAGGGAVYKNTLG